MSTWNRMRCGLFAGSVLGLALTAATSGAEDVASAVVKPIGRLEKGTVADRRLRPGREPAASVTAGAGPGRAPVPASRAEMPGLPLPGSEPIAVG